VVHRQAKLAPGEGVAQITLGLGIALFRSDAEGGELVDASAALLRLADGERKPVMQTSAAINGVFMGLSVVSR
jgi:hypothetical protein